MTDCAPFKSELHAKLSEATEVVNGWRGRCVNLFARAEAAIGATLAGKEPGNKLPMLVSQKAKRLARHLASNAAQQSLSEFVAYLGDRTALTHGPGKLWVDKGGQWLLTLDWISGKGLERRVFTAKEADTFHKEIQTAVRRLEQHLRVA